MMHVNYVAIVVAAIASVLWGWVWHTSGICGKKWAPWASSDCAMHKDMDKQQTRISTFISFIAALLTAYVLSRFLEVAETSNLVVEKTAYRYGFLVAFLAWLGFCVPMALNVTVWMKKHWKFFFAKIFQNAVNLLIMTMILAYWGTMNTTV